jgi:hypothetical protein
LARKDTKPTVASAKAAAAAKKAKVEFLKKEKVFDIQEASKATFDKDASVWYNKFNREFKDS